MLILVLGGLVAAAWAAGSARRPNPGPVKDQRASVALFLYGQDDPDSVTAAGLHGLGGRPVHISIRTIGPCRFAVATADRSETIDFHRITVIRHTEVLDPAAGLARIAGQAGGGEPLPRLPLAILVGAEDAICDQQACIGRRAFALSDPGRLGAARAAAAAFQRDICPPDAVAAP